LAGKRRITVLLTAAVCTLIGAGIALAPGAEAIADGRDVPDGRYRFSAALSMPKITRPDGSTYASACSGALISARWVITAGHCLHDGARNRISGPPRYEVRVTVGRATLSGPGGQTRQVVEVRQSPTNDVAVVRLDRPVYGIVPMLLARRAPRAGEVLRLTGWGSKDAEADLSHRPDRLQTGLVKVSEFTETEVLVHGLAPHPTTSACPYDSGAPYFRPTHGTAVLVATEVTGPDCPHDQNETTARIDTIASWITAQLAGAA
jgi:secreted trypsin-like serine protease